MSSNGWIGVDFDGTLAFYERKKYRSGEVGPPIPKMLARVKQMLEAGKTVKIFTARAYPFTDVDADADYMALQISARALRGEQADRANDALLNIAAIRTFCMDHLGRVLTITCVKDFYMDELWDDRAIQVVHNTGDRADGTP
jgi:hypothetical protein